MLRRYVSEAGAASSSKNPHVFSEVQLWFSLQKTLQIAPWPSVFKRKALEESAHLGHSQACCCCRDIHEHGATKTSQKVTGASTSFTHGAAIRESDLGGRSTENVRLGNKDFRGQWNEKMKARWPCSSRGSKVTAHVRAAGVVTVPAFAD